jgi:hypothetical protein
VSDALQQILEAAKTAAGAKWSVVQADVTAFSKALVDASEQTAENLAKGLITEAEAKVEFDALVDYAAILANYTSVALKAIAQAALNAAVDALWGIIAKAV